MDMNLKNLKMNLMDYNKSAESRILEVMRDDNKRKCLQKAINQRD